MVKCRIRLRIFAILSILAVCFIFSNSLLDREASSQQSGSVTAFIAGLLGMEDCSESLHALVRKTAHFCEFAFLGICLACFTYNLGRLRERKYIALPALCALTVAVADEFIQFFTGRGSAVTDVVLDYAGALFGIFFTIAFIHLLSYIKRRIRGKEPRTKAL